MITFHCHCSEYMRVISTGNSDGSHSVNLKMSFIEGGLSQAKWVFCGWMITFERGNLDHKAGS